MIFTSFSIFIFSILILCESKDLKNENCVNLSDNTTLTLNIENEGFHRVVRWLVEFQNVIHDKCIIALKQDVPSGAFVNTDQISDLNRIGKTNIFVEGNIDVELPKHHSKGHIVYVYKNVTSQRLDLELPIHLRYQRPQIGGGFGKVELPLPWIFSRCPKSDIRICGNSVETHNSHRHSENVIWTNISYKSLSEPLELFVPVGDLDQYPLVSIATFLVTCTGCIYLLSVILSNPPIKYKLDD